MLKDSYKIIIYGDSLCSMLTAAALSKKEVDVLFINKVKPPVEGQPFPEELHHMPLEGILDISIVRNMLLNIGVDLSNENLFRRSELPLQLVFGNERIDLVSDIEENSGDLCCGFEGDAGKLSEIIRESLKKRVSANEVLLSGRDIFPPHSFWKKLSYMVRRRAGKNPLPLDTLSSNLKAIGNSSLIKSVDEALTELCVPLKDAGAGRRLIPLALSGAPVYFPRQGMAGLKAAIIEGLRINGVDVADVETLSAVNFRNGNVSSVTFRELTVRTKAFLFGAIPMELIPFLPSAYAGKVLKKRLSDQRPWGGWESVFIELDEDVVPAGMGSRLVVKTEEGDTLLVERGFEKNRDIPVSAGHSLFKISRQSPFEKTDDVAADATARPEDTTRIGIEAAAVRELERLVPFLDGRYKVLCSHDGKGLSPDDYICSGPGAAPFGVGTLTPFTPFSNLLLAGKGLMPVLGFEGDFISATLLSSYIYNIAVPPVK